MLVVCRHILVHCVGCRYCAPMWVHIRTLLCECTQQQINVWMPTKKEEYTHSGEQKNTTTGECAFKQAWNTVRSFRIVRTVIVVRTYTNIKKPQHCSAHIHDPTSWCALVAATTSLQIRSAYMRTRMQRTRTRSQTTCTHADVCVCICTYNDDHHHNIFRSIGARIRAYVRCDIGHACLVFVVVVVFDVLFPSCMYTKRGR